MKSWKKLILQALPGYAKGPLIRALLKVPDSYDDQLLFELAQTQVDRLGAFSLVYSCYLNTGSEKENSSGVRLNPFLALPTTQIIVAKYNHQIIGTLSIIAGGSFGLPANEKISLNNFEASRQKVAELSSLAVHKEHRGESGKIFFGLIKFALELNKRHLGVEHIITMVRADKVDPFIQILGFKYLTNKLVKNYKYSNNADVYSLILDINEFPFWLYKHYGKREKNKNLFHFICEKELANFKLPDSRYHIAHVNILSKKEIRLLHLSWGENLDLLNQGQVSLLKTHYPQFKKENHQVDLQTCRYEPRFEFPHNGLIITADSELIRVKITDISLSGLGMYTTQNLQHDMTFKIKIKLGEFDTALIEAQIVRINRTDKKYGLKITKSDNKWSRYFEFLEECKVA